MVSTNLALFCTLTVPKVVLDASFTHSHTYGGSYHARCHQEQTGSVACRRTLQNNLGGNGGEVYFCNGSTTAFLKISANLPCINVHSIFSVQHGLSFHYLLLQIAAEFSGPSTVQTMFFFFPRLCLCHNQEETLNYITIVCSWEKTGQDCHELIKNHQE